MNLLRRMRASSPYGASSDTISLLRKGKTSKPRLRLEENRKTSLCSMVMNPFRRMRATFP